MRKFTEGTLDTERILKTLHIRSGQSIVDAGCGTGYMSGIFARSVGEGGQVFAVDKDSQFINIARNERLEPNVTVLQEDITQQTSIRAASVDCVYTAAMIQMLSQKQLRQFIQEVKRLLKPGGILGIVTFEKKESQCGPLLHQRQSPEELQATIPLAPGETVGVSDELYLQTFTYAE